MKAESRVLAFDDGPFRWEDATVPVVGVVMRGGSYLEAVLRTDVGVDGDDATEKLVERVNASRYRGDLHAILLDGATLGGFNVVDLEALHRETGIPVLAVTRGIPDLDAVRAALFAHSAAAERKWRLLTSPPLEVVPTATTPLSLRPVGLTRDEAVTLLARTTVRGLVPEPLRVAHLIATGVVTGESRGQ